MEYKSISEDFEVLFIVMSKKFIDSSTPNAQERLPLLLTVYNNPVVPLDEEKKMKFILFCTQLSLSLPRLTF